MSFSPCLISLSAKVRKLLRDNSFSHRKKHLPPINKALHHMGRPRERRPWFNRSWYISVEVLKRHMAAILGDQFAGAFDNLTDRQRG